MTNQVKKGLMHAIFYRLHVADGEGWLTAKAEAAMR